MDSTRRIYLDNIRWITVCIVVIYHVIYMYNGVQPFGVIGPFKEQQLQDAGSCQRDGEQDDLLKHRAAGQVSGAACLSHEKSASFLSFTRRSCFPKHCTLLRRTASEM